MARVLKLSGFCGIDFILDDSDRRAHIIDLNPRVIQTCHLMSAEGKSIIASFVARSIDRPVEPGTKRSFESEKIAMEFQRREVRALG